MINHPNRSKSAILLAQGCDIARAILADGSLTLIGDAAHDSGVIARQRGALIAVEKAMHAYNSADHDQTIPAYRDADSLRQTLREGAIALSARIAYEAGRAAYLRGEPKLSCTLTDESNKRAWNDGWLRAFKTVALY